MHCSFDTTVAAALELHEARRAKPGRFDDMQETDYAHNSPVVYTMLAVVRRPPWSVVLARGLGAAQLAVMVTAGG